MSLQRLSLLAFDRHVQALDCMPCTTSVIRPTEFLGLKCVGLHLGLCVSILHAVRQRRADTFRAAPTSSMCWFRVLSSTKQAIAASAMAVVVLASEPGTSNR